jgi:hypothetical protein
MDKGYYEFKTRMLAHLSTMQDSDSEETRKLRARNHDLELMLAQSEADQMALKKKADAEMNKAHTAAREAADWKAQFEGLKNTLQGVLGQRM